MMVVDVAVSAHLGLQLKHIVTISSDRMVGTCIRAQVPRAVMLEILIVIRWEYSLLSFYFLSASCLLRILVILLPGLESIIEVLQFLGQVRATTHCQSILQDLHL